MRLRVLVINGLVLGAIGWMAVINGGDERAAQLLPKDKPGTAPADVAALEEHAAVAKSASTVAALAGAYLDRDQPGLASSVIESASPEVRRTPAVAHLEARALFHRGRARDALAVAKAAEDACADGPCPGWLVAKTTRQVAFLEQVVAAGIDDPEVAPDAVRAAYDRSSHEVRLIAMR